MFEEENWVDLESPKRLKDCTVIANIKKMVAIVIYPDGRKFRIDLGKVFDFLPDVPKEDE